MKLTHTAKTFLTGLTLVSALALTACSGDTTGPSATPTGSASSATGGGTSSPDKTSSGGGGGSTPGSTTAGNSVGANGSGQGKSGGTSGGEGTAAGNGGNSGKSIGICRTDELEISAVDNTIDASEGIVTVQLKNGGGRDCIIHGFAGVDLKTAAGDTLSVTRNSEKPVRAVIKDGESAAFNITFPVNNSGGSGVRVAKILVTPPNETKTVTLDWPAGTLPVENPDSPGLPLQINPAGKVG
ncbi:DUF4232 domain-containing protein [Streptomyces sp. NPDC090127]|uniref:DUF4232 domain-containing protein n=1 Tax=Streptomyces sp. NPDC090127 TaxID=3365953 RepID=UPI0038113C79